MAAPVDNTKVVYRGQPSATLPTASPGNYMSSTSGNGEIIKEVIVANVSASNTNCQMCVVPSGGTASSANAIMWNKTVPANDIVILSLSTDMSPGDFISLQSQTANNLTFTITTYQK